MAPRGRTVTRPHAPMRAGRTHRRGRSPSTHRPPADQASSATFLLFSAPTSLVGCSSRRYIGCGLRVLRRGTPRGRLAWTGKVNVRGRRGSEGDLRGGGVGCAEQRGWGDRGRRGGQIGAAGALARRGPKGVRVVHVGQAEAGAEEGNRVRGGEVGDLWAPRSLSRRAFGATGPRRHPPAR
ncbi:hypothetical protein DFJ74DRAFT_140877 [Hyaloraphidium curvatum]|nr:hypothetical protein DFJ74DRAFT_140877 [Hyaloraphidium curvatum]